jgi:hypothetical protein
MRPQKRCRNPSSKAAISTASTPVDGSSSTRWKVFLGTTSCCGTAWPVSLGFSGLFDDFAFFGVLAVDIAALLEGFRHRFCGLMTIDDQVAVDFLK